MQYITSNIINKLIEYGPYKSIPRLLKHIHFNPKHKENQNIKIPIEKRNMLKYIMEQNGNLEIKKKQ